MRCPTCDRYVRNKEDLYRHMRIIHGVDNAKPKTN